MFIAIDLDNTFADYTAAFKDCLDQLGYHDYVDAPDPADYSFACDGWFRDEHTFPPLHRRAVELGLYLRERPYEGASDAVCGLARTHRIMFATSRGDDGVDTTRWMRVYGFDAAGYGLRHVADKTGLDADLTVEDNPATLDRLMDLGMRVLVRRHAYNLPQCERAEHAGLGFAFDDWTQVPALAALFDSEDNPINPHPTTNPEREERDYVE